MNYNKFKKQQSGLQMDKEQNEDQQKYIPSHLLDDDDVPTNTSFKNTKESMKEFAFSAPPILFNLGYRIEEDFFEEERHNTKLNLFHSPQKYSDNDKQYETTEFQNIVMSTRKLSLQNEEQYASYGSYQSISLPKINYYPTYSPEQQILNNLHYVPEWCRDQYGSRNIQNVLESENQFLKSKIFLTILPRINELCYDKFANYVIQKYIEIGTEEQKTIVEENIKKELLFMTLHSYACRVIQKIIQISAGCINKQKDILKYLQPHLLQVILNQNGNHIAQRIIQIFQFETTEHLSCILLSQLQKLAYHSFGCRVVQKYLQNGRNDKIKNAMLKQLINNSIRLSKCQYGNYIMQYIVSVSTQHQEKVFNVLIQHFCDLSCNKFASNVIEKFIKSAKQTQKQKLIEKITSKQQLAIISKNQFGNYVIQSLFEHSSKESRLLLKFHLKQSCQEISKSQYGRHVLMQIEKYK